MRGVLAQVRAAVEDWQPMRERMQALIDEPRARAGIDAAEVEESQALLRWVADHHFTFLGYREYELDGDALRADRGHRARAAARRRGARLDGVRQAAAGRARAARCEPHPLVLTKANTRSPVHRPATSTTSASSGSTPTAR